MSASNNPANIGKRVVLITGAASGVGRRIAEAFVDTDAAVHVCDVSTRNIDGFLAENPTVTATVADVGNAADVERIYDDVRSLHGQLDVLINNAGIAGETGPVQDLSIEAWDRCIAVDLNGVFYITRLAIPLLSKSPDASIINISSTGGLHGYPLRSPYAASKWALIGLTKTWAMELGPGDIRVNAICPGSVSGERIDSVIQKDAETRGVSSDDVRDVYLKQTSMRCFVDSDDIAHLAVFLASKQAGKISGQVIAVDGHTESLSNWLD